MTALACIAIVGATLVVAHDVYPLWVPIKGTPTAALIVDFGVRIA